MGVWAHGMQVLLVLTLGALPVFLFIQAGGAGAVGSNPLVWGLIVACVLVVGGIAYRTRRSVPAAWIAGAREGAAEE